MQLLTQLLTHTLIFCLSFLLCGSVIIADDNEVLTDNGPGNIIDGQGNDQGDINYNAASSL